VVRGTLTEPERWFFLSNILYVPCVRLLNPRLEEHTMLSRLNVLSQYLFCSERSFYHLLRLVNIHALIKTWPNAQKQSMCMGRGWIEMVLTAEHEIQIQLLPNYKYLILPISTHWSVAENYSSVVGQRYSSKHYMGGLYNRCSLSLPSLLNVSLCQHLLRHEGP